MQPIEPSTAAAHDGINMLALVLHASIPVQLVMLLLLFGSIAPYVALFGTVWIGRASCRERV